MRRKEKTENGILRAAFAAVSLIVQIAWILLRIQYLNAYSDLIAGIMALLTIIVVLKLNSKHTNSAMKMPWVMLIMASPVMGLCMYLLFVLLGDPGVGKSGKKCGCKSFKVQERRLRNWSRKIPLLQTRAAIYGIRQAIRSTEAPG